MASLYQERLKGAANPHWKGGSVDKTCPVCGRIFKAIPVEANSRHYCSYNCMGMARRKSRQERMKVGPTSYHPPLPRPEHKCKLCGRPISSRRIYCPTCSPRGKSTLISNCEVCGKSIKHWKGINRRFCSNECRLKKHTAEGNPNWKGGRMTLAQRIRGCEKNRTLIARILKRDKFTCQQCGQVGGDLEVDHIIPFASILEDFLQHYNVLSTPEFEYELYLIALKYKPFWVKTNLRTLCRKCNWERHIHHED